MNLSFKKTCIIISIDLAIYNFMLIFFHNPIPFAKMLYYLLSFDILLYFMIPFFRHEAMPKKRKPEFKNQEDVRLLYQATIPDAERITDDELYHMICLRSAVPKHDCTNAEYIQFLKRRGFLIINGKHIWLYGYPR